MKNIFKRHLFNRHLNVQRTVFAAIAGLSLLFAFASCSNGFFGNAEENGANSSRAALTSTDLIESASVDIKLVLLGAPSTNEKPGVWAWAEASSDVNYQTDGWPGKLEMTKGTESGYDVYTYTLKVNPEYDLGILFNNISGGSPQTKDITIPKDKISAATTLYFNWNSMAYYDKIEDCVGIFSGEITKLDSDAKTAEITIVTSLLDSVDQTKLTVTDSANNSLSVTSATLSGDTLTVVVGAGSGDVSKTPYKVTYNGKDVSAGISMSLIENLYGTKAKDVEGLGLTLNSSSATFKTWAPSATSVNLLLYTDSTKIGNFKALTVAAKASGSCDETELKGTPAKTEVMTSDTTTGVWSATISDANSYKYYKYEIENNGTKYYVSDIWHTVASGDSIASQLVSIDDSSAQPANWENAYTNPFGNTGAETKKYNDAVIYEMHIRDWSRAFVSDSKGKFLDIANNLGTNGAFASHLKELGVTHVQILPMFDYAQVNADENYNWGYNPYHYNVPEGRYVTDGYTDGTQAVKEARQMIQAFHEAGISVIMDVVYNHTAATEGGSLYDSTVPKYFYRQSSDGGYSNGSGVGNETASERAMVKRYFLESLKHWVNDYHINGFRFDLMGVHDTEFMKEVYDELYKIDKNILVYGEPWAGGTVNITSGYTVATAAGKGTTGYGYGAFEDDFRDAIKGVDSFSFSLGHVQGSFADSTIVDGLLGKVLKNARNPTGDPGLALHYVECHDNYTLFDKLVYSTIVSEGGSVSKDSDAGKFAAAYNSVMNDSAKLDLIKKQDKLSAAYIFLSQGTPFINGGQEFMRTKKGNPDSYSAGTKGGITWTNTAGEYNIDDVNTIDLSMKTTYADVYNVYRGLIALRKDYSAFRGYGSADAEKLSDGVTKYTVSASDGDFTVVFNATDSAAGISGINGKIVDVETRLSANGTYFGLGFGDVDVDVDVEPYRVYKDVSTVSSVPAKSFVIIKTN